MIDIEVRALINDVYEQTKELLTEHREGLEKIAQALLQREIIFQSDLEDLLGKRPFDTRTTYDEFVNGAIVEEAKAEEVITEETSTIAVEPIPDILNEDTDKNI